MTQSPVTVGPVSKNSMSFDVAGVFGVLLVTMMLTRTEFNIGSNGPAVSLILRILSGTLLVFLILVKYGAPRKRVLLATLITTFVFVGINLTDLRPFTILASLSIFLGLLLAELTTVRRSGWVVHFVRGFMIVNVAALLIEVSFYFAGFGFLNVHGLVFPWSDARNGVFIGVARFSGLQVEPGTYANVVYLSVVISSLARRKISGAYEFVAMLSTLATLSAWAPIAVSAFLFGSLIEVTMQRSANLSLKKRLLYSLSCLVTVLAGLFWILSPEQVSIQEYFLTRLDLSDGAGSIRFKAEALEQWLDNLWLEMMLPHQLSDAFCAQCISPQDLGFGFNLIYYIGIVLSVFLFAPLIYKLVKEYGLAFVFLLLPLFINKAFFYDSAVWLIIGMVLLRPRRERRVLRNPSGIAFHSAYNKVGL